jgi:hypothetical protein
MKTDMLGFAFFIFQPDTHFCIVPAIWIAEHGWIPF